MKYKDTCQNIMNVENLIKIISIGDNDIKNGNIVTHENIKIIISKVLQSESSLK